MLVGLERRVLVGSGAGYFLFFEAGGDLLIVGEEIDNIVRRILLQAFPKSAD